MIVPTLIHKIIISCWKLLFKIFRFHAIVNSDNDKNFVSTEVKQFLQREASRLRLLLFE